jgi:hypothetical protein
VVRRLLPQETRVTGTIGMSPGRAAASLTALKSAVSGNRRLTAAPGAFFAGLPACPATPCRRNRERAWLAVDWRLVQAGGQF